VFHMIRKEKLKRILEWSDINVQIWMK
jgi:hypothetical protein